MKKKGYFFTLDAMLSLGILTIGSFLIFSSLANIPSRGQTGILAEDVADFMAATKIGDLNNPYAGLGGELWDQGYITNQDNTLLQQVGEFYYKNELKIAENFIINITDNLIPSQFRLEFWIDDVLLFPSSPSQQHINSKDNTRLLLPSKKIIYGILNESANIFGPYEAEVLVWQ